MDKMLCMQCEQTAKGVACTTAGVCGKSAATAQLQDELTGTLIGAAAAGVAVEDKLLLEGLFATLTNVNFDDAALEALIAQVRGSSAELVAYDLAQLQYQPGTDEDTRSLKTLLLLGLRGVAAYAYHALVLGYAPSDICVFLRRAMAALAQESYEDGELLSLVMDCGKANLDALALLDQANTETFGTPEPTEVSRVIEPGPAIIVSGHDLHDLQLLLEQSQGRGVNVYTHGELLPAHAYPKFKSYPHLKGNFGSAWQNQQKEFDGVPAAFLFTTNCLMSPRESYADRVFTTACVGYPGLQHISADGGAGKDFTPVIEKALELGGYQEAQGAGSFTTGFGQGAVLSVAGTVIDAVKTGAIKHFFLVGGCDGARPGRNYFTEFVKQTPADTVILTLACGKYRFNDLELGSIGGLPRLLDMGQCNDAYSAVKVALALADAFDCGVNDLPLTMVLSWYEQKAVSILLSLLYLDIKNIRLGPSLPAFISPNILNFLVESFGIQPISTPEADLAEILA
jgi:hydroxylamine reductase